MNRPSNIRNISCIGCSGHGKSTLLDILVSKSIAGTSSGAGDTKIEHGDESHRIAAKSNAISLCFKLDDEELLKVRQKTKGNEFLINLIDCPGGINLVSEIPAALRLTDGVLVVLDVLDDFGIQIERALRQALTERVKPVLVLSRVDRALLELQTDKEPLYQLFRGTIDSVNCSIRVHHDEALGNIEVDPCKGTVAFTSCLYGWGFTLTQFATKYAKKFVVDREKMAQKLWGDNYFNPKTRKWNTKGVDGEGNPLERSFNQFVLDPIFRIFDAVLSSRDKLGPILLKLNITLSPDEQLLEGKPLLKVVMGKLLPASDSILEQAVVHLPSPVTAQSYRVGMLYEGPTDDESAVGMRRCDPNGPLVLYVSKMVPTSEKGRFYALGRVFSGTVRSGVKLRIQGPNYHPNPYRKDDLFIKSLESTVLMMRNYVEALKDCPAGNIVGIGGIDQLLLNAGTLTTLEKAHNLKPMRPSSSPVIQVAVEVEHAVDLPKLVDGLKYLSKHNPSITTSLLESGEHVVAGDSQDYLEAGLKDLEDVHAGVPLKFSDLVISYRETVKAESRIVALARSQNRHNRLYVKAMPIEHDLLEAIEGGIISARDDFRRRAGILTDKYGWDATSAKRIWCFGPDTTGPNLLVDATKSVQYMYEIKDSCVSGFQWATKEGVCAEEIVWGVQYNIVDVVSNVDAIHRGGGQIIPTIRRACYAASLLADPGLQQPVSHVEVICPENVTGIVYHCLNQHGAQILSERKRPETTPAVALNVYLPMSVTFDLRSELCSRTNGQAFARISFDHWETMKGSPLEKGGEIEGIVRTIRSRKGLKPEIPSLDTYLDRQ